MLPGSPGVAFAKGRPRLVAGFTAEREGRRRYADLVRVAAVPPGRSAQRVQYWTFAGVADDVHREALRGMPVSYDLTVLSACPMGWERSKTHGHVHVRRGTPRTSFPELYEVLEGRAGFLVQDLHHGPTSTFAALIEATDGQLVVVPPGLHHATINLGRTPLVIADLVCRASDDDYGQLQAAHGMAHYVRADGEVVHNPNYRSVPTLDRLGAEEWSGSWTGPLYGHLTEGSATLEWLCTPSAHPLGDSPRRPPPRE